MNRYKHLTDLTLPGNSLHLHRAAHSLRQGGIWAYPTEAVWGLGCDPDCDDAVLDLLAMKQRPWEKGLIMVASGVHQIEHLLAPLEPGMRERIMGYWPAPVTVLVPDYEHQVSPLVRGSHDSVAVRVSAYQPVIDLCDAFGGPLVSTSCNPAGRAPARYVWQVRQYFQGQLDGILPGRVGGATRPSRIIDAISGRVLRS